MSYRYGLAALAASALLGLAGAPVAYAGADTPAFAVQSFSNSAMRMGFNAYQKGDYAKAIKFTTKATAKGNKKSRRSIAYANLCASYGQQNTLDAALKACNTALDLSSANWRALNNRGVVHYLVGDQDAAAADFKAATAFPKADIAQANADLMAATKLATSE